MSETNLRRWVVGVTTGLIVWLVAQLVASVWWASSVNTTLTFMNEAQKKIGTQIEKLEGDNTTHTQLEIRTTLVEREVVAIKLRMDQLEQVLKEIQKSNKTGG